MRISLVNRVPGNYILVEGHSHLLNVRCHKCLIKRELFWPDLRAYWIQIKDHNLTFIDLTLNFLYIFFQDRAMIIL